MKAVNSIVGWQYPPSAIREWLSSETPRMLTMDFDYGSSKPCNLKCRYCFIETDERQLDEHHALRHEKPTVDHIQLQKLFRKEAEIGCKSAIAGTQAQQKLSIDELKDVFRQAAQLGCRSGKLVGDQESLQEPRFMEFVEYLSEELGMWLVLFTNAAILDNDNACKAIHKMDSAEVLKKLKSWRVSIMVKFHSFSNEIEDQVVGSKGYAERRNRVLQRLLDAAFNEPPVFRSAEEKFVMTGYDESTPAEDWTRLGLESVLTPQCLQDAEEIYRLKATKRLFIDLDPPVPVGLTRSEEFRRKYGLHVPPEQALELCKRLYEINEEYGIPFEGGSPYMGGLPCSQLPYSLYVNARGRIFPCCGTPDIEVNGRSDYLGHAREPGALAQAIEKNPYRLHYKAKGHAYAHAPFNDPAYPGYGIYHSCPYRDRAGDIMPKNWEIEVEKHVKSLAKKENGHENVIETDRHSHGSACGSAERVQQVEH